MKVHTQNKKKLRRQARSKTCPAVSPNSRKPVRFSLMAKPVGPACNLRCTYCFYLEKEALFAREQVRRMPDEILEAYIRKYIASEPARDVTFHWQGGEPTLMGLDFFRRAMELQRRHAGGKRITNTIQTNGTLLDDDWGRLLAGNDWLVGISLDGPRDIHDANRPDAAGRGSFDAVLRGLDVLKRHNVQFNVLASVTPLSTADPLRIYEFLRNSGVTFVQFMPIVERLPDAEARELGLDLAVGVRSGEALPTVEMTPWSVQPEAYGEFLVTIFNRWVRRDVGSLFVMNFEWALANYLRKPSQACGFMPVCGRSLIIEHNGDIYACDHYVYPKYRLGNILTEDLQDMVQSEAQCAFGKAKCKTLPRCCQECPVLAGCWGECPKRRFVPAPDGEPGLNYLCAGYKQFFTHAAPYFEAMSRLKQAGQPMTKIMETEIYLLPRNIPGRLL